MDLICMIWYGYDIIWIYSKIAQHVEKKNHRPDFNNTAIMNKSDNYHQRLFLEAWYSIRDPKASFPVIAKTGAQLAASACI